ncbi:helix-turn-helix domain-containing protein, partial [Mesonia sp. MT50]
MSQITLEQRYEIAALRNAGNTLEYIGNLLGFHKGTISNELRRNRDGRSGEYKPKLAEKKCRQRHQNKPKRIHFIPEI